MSDAPYLTDGSHLLVTGPTGARTDYGGKSSWTAWLVDGPGQEADLVIIGNYKLDDFAGVLDGYVEVGSVEALAHAYGEGHRRLILSPTNPDWPLVSRRLEALVRRLPRDERKLVVHDEAPELDATALLSFVRVHGNGTNCKSVVIAQSPGDLDHSIIKQCIVVWVGPVPETYRSWFAANDYRPHFEYLQRAGEPYHWVVMLGPDDADRDHFEPVSEDYIL